MIAQHQIPTTTNSYSKFEKYILYCGFILICTAVIVFVYAYITRDTYEPASLHLAPKHLNKNQNTSTTTNPGILPYKSGVEGKVTIGPTCPVERIPPDPQCADKPYQATLIIKNAAGHIVINQKINTDGTFKFSLPPGKYTIEDGAGAMMPRLSPVNVEVGPNIYTEVNLSYDSGIR